MGMVAWFAGFIGLIVAAAVVSGRGRATPSDVVARSIVGTAGAAYALLVIAAVWTWGGTTAANGRADRLREGASVSVTLRGLRMKLERSIAIGHGPAADVRTPGAGDGRLAELELTRSDAKEPARVVARAVASDAVVVAVPAGADPAATATARGCEPDRAPYVLPPAATVVVVECAAGKPVRAIAVRRDHARAELVLSPLAWRGRFVPERLVVRAGDVLRVGGGDVAIPGVNTWDVITLRDSTAMLAVPTDPTDCAAWSPEVGTVREAGGGCEVDTGAFAVAALPLLPDPDAVVGRAARAAFAIGGPPLALVLALVLARRRGRRAHLVARALRLCVLGAGLTALACWRLLWAYRIDVLRELATVGPRLLENQLAVAAIGAALAGNAAYALEAREGTARRAGFAVVAWAVWLGVAWLAVGLGTPEWSPKAGGVLALSLAAALAPVASEVGAAWTRRLGPEVALGAIALGAVVARIGAHRSALLKLALAYATVLAGHAALRTAVARDTSVRRRIGVLVALGAATLAIASFDTGVSLAIAGTGLALAMLVAGHDSMYDASQAERLGLLEREHARLLLVHAAAAIVIAIGVVTAALVATDRGLIERGAIAVLHAPLAVAALFGLAAVVARSHRRGWAPWLAAALAALAVWGARDMIVERATSGGGVAARRVSALVEPGYALLRDQRAFAANISAWREAALAPDDEVDPWRGQGYFGARVRDPGVSRSIDNDYLPVLVAREGGVAGLTQGIALLLSLIVGAGAIASIRLRHASREHRARWLITAVAATIAVYQPLAALGVLPLTGISWPGLGIDSPADLWLFVIGAVWCLMAGESAVADDERVRRSPRLVRARKLVIAALAIAGLGAVIVVARAGACALARVTTDDVRIETALQYAGSLQCAWPDKTGPTVEDVVPVLIAGTPTDGATARFELELRTAWLAERPKLVAALTPKPLAPAPSGDAQPAVPTGGSGDARPASPTSPSATTPGPSASPATPSPTSAFGRADLGGGFGGARMMLVANPSSDVAPPPSAPDDAPPRRAEAARKRTAKGDPPAAVDLVRDDDDRTVKRKRSPASGDDGPAARKRARGGDDDPAKPEGKARGAATDSAAQSDPDDEKADDDDAEPAKPRPAALATTACKGRVGRFQLVREGEGCVARLSTGGPEIRLALQPAGDGGVRATCAITRDDDAIAAIRGPVRAKQAPRIRVVSAAVGAAAGDLGEVVSGTRIVRLRAGAAPIELAAAAPGLRAASKITVGPGVTLELQPAAGTVVLRGSAELFVAAEGGAWRRMIYAKELILDDITLIVVGAPDHRTIALFRPRRAWGDAKVVDALLADDTNRVGDRARRAYPYGSTLAELGWVNPYEVERSLGLDGWIHAAHVQPAVGPQAACGTLQPPAIAMERVCTKSPLDGVLECRIALQPELSLALREIADAALADPKPHTGRDVHPVRAAYVVLRGDTGELLAHGNVVPGRPPLAYAPANADAEAELVRLREERGESDAERAEWNLPIAVGSTLKPLVARAAELAFPHDMPRLQLAAAGSAPGCPSRRGVSVSPLLGHCPPTSLAGEPTAADLHDFLARSPNWYQAALGLVGLALPDGRMSAGDAPVSLAEIAASDLASWQKTNRLLIADATGPILHRRGLSIAGLRRTPLWTRLESVLGRPVCSLGDRARCERAAARADVCAARGLPLASPGADLRYLVSLGPDRIDPYADDRPGQSSVPVREYLQLLRGSGVHPIGSLAQLVDAFGRVIYDPEAQHLAASWFPAPAAGKLPGYSCADASGHAATVRGADGGLCAVLRDGGTAHKAAGSLLAEPKVIVYGAKTGTIDSLADIARRPSACAAWNARHAKPAQLECGKTPPDDSLFVVAFGIVTPKGTVPITLGIQLQRSGAGGAARLAPELVRAIRAYFAP